MLLLRPADDVEAEEVLIMGHPVETPNAPPWKSAVERQYEAFLEKLSPKGRSSMQKHDELCDTQGPPEHWALWKRFAGTLSRLAGHIVEISGQHSAKFYIADGNYKLQVFALEDTRQGAIAVYLPDVVPAALTEKLLTAGSSAQHFKVSGSPEQIELAPISSETRDLTVCKAMVGWGRQARRVEFTIPHREPHVLAVERMCQLAADKWAVPPAAAVKS